MKNILLVDDDNIFNFLNTKLLQQSGITNEIHTAVNGKEALDLLNKYYMRTAAQCDFTGPEYARYGWVQFPRSLQKDQLAPEREGHHHHRYLIGKP